MADNINERLAREFTAGQIDTERAPSAPTLFTPTEDMSSVVRAIKALTSTVNQLMGRSGTAFDKAVSLRDLVASGVLALKIGGTVVSASPTPTGSGGGVVIPAEPDGPGYRDPRPVLSVPPTLTEVVAHGAFRNVIVVWKRVDYRNHAYVEVWRSLTDNLGTAVRIGTTSANLYADATGQPDTTYYYWVRAVNIEGAIGAFNGVAGTPGTLAPLVDEEVPPQFIKRAMIALAAIDDALIANLSAAKVTFGEMSGDRIAANSLHGDKITANTIQGDRIMANSITASHVNGYNLRVTAGSYVSFSSPISGLSGFYLGPEGLLMGNVFDNKYLRLEAGGNIYAPGFSIVNGNATFGGALAAATGSFEGALLAATGTFAGTLTASAVNAVNTVNIAGDAVTLHGTDLFFDDNSVDMDFVSSQVMAHTGQVTFLVVVQALGTASGSTITVSSVDATASGSGATYTSTSEQTTDGIGAINPQIHLLTATTTVTGLTINCNIHINLTNMATHTTTGQRGARVSVLKLRKFR